MTNKSDKTQGGPMIKFLAKLFPCKHPLDKVRLIKCGTEPYDHVSINQTTTEDYICLNCYEMVTKKYRGCGLNLI